MPPATYPAKPRGHGAGTHPLEEEHVTYYDDETLLKVRAGILRSLPWLGEDAVTGIITHMQNEGILFREHDRDSDPLAMVTGHPSQLTDGFHTMEELYEHRRALTAALAMTYVEQFPNGAWRSKAHHPDDGPMFEGGYFIVGINLPTGTITYHYKLAHWDDFALVPEVGHAPKWDGATPNDTVTRLLAEARNEAQYVWEKRS